MRSYPQFSFWISITLGKIYLLVSCIIINRGKSNFELVGTVLNMFKTRRQPNFVSLQSLNSRILPIIHCAPFHCWKFLHRFAHHCQHHPTYYSQHAYMPTCYTPTRLRVALPSPLTLTLPFFSFGGRVRLHVGYSHQCWELVRSFTWSLRFPCGSFTKQRAISKFSQQF